MAAPPEDAEGSPRAAGELSTAEVARLRGAHLPRNLRVQYRASGLPGLHVVSGKGSVLHAADGEAYLDCVNNVAHVGHSHPKVSLAMAAQMVRVNTNTRYLSTGLVTYSRRLSNLMPDGLNVVFMVTSGSEANDLALRLVRTASNPGATHIAVLGCAYHGHTLATLGISPYKFEGRGGFPCPPHVHIIPCPDAYRGANIDGKEAARAAIAKASAAEGRIAAFFFEAYPSCAGQIVLPEGYLRDLCDEMRSHGALSVADEVQCGFGRVGKAYWGFQACGVVPDVVTLGKGIGNGFPMGAVVTTQATAESFANGMEYFNTGGGCNLACAAGLAVLDAIEDEGLQERAAATGDHLLAGLCGLASRCTVIGDVRGSGLFAGLEIVMDVQTNKDPAPHVADWVVSACMRCHNVLLSTDGPNNNVIKLKPPMCFGKEEADELLQALSSVMLEDLPARLADLLALDRMVLEAKGSEEHLKRQLQRALRGPAAPSSGQSSTGGTRQTLSSPDIRQQHGGGAPSAMQVPTEPASLQHKTAPLPAGDAVLRSTCGTHRQPSPIDSNVRWQMAATLLAGLFAGTCVGFSLARQQRE